MRGLFLPFSSPVFLVLLCVLGPILAGFLLWSWRRRTRALAAFVHSRLIARLVPGYQPWRHQVKRWTVFAGIVVLMVALARPLWGHLEEESRGSGLDIVVCFDVSRSMMAPDLKPSRLQRAKLAAFDLARLAKGDRVGLVAFAGTAFLQCPLALDPEAFRQSVNALDTDIIPEAGTAMAQAIREARQAFTRESGASRVIVVITDGEDHEPGAMEAARECAQDGIRVYTVGAGLGDGEVLRTADPYGNPVFIRDEQGNPVRSRLNETLLRGVAETAQGFYVPLQDPQAMRTLYERGISTLRRGEFSGGRVRQPRERFQWVMALAAVLLLLDVVFPEERLPWAATRPRGRSRGGGQAPQASLEAKEISS